jgi:hypothetical protein
MRCRRTWAGLALAAAGSVLAACGASAQPATSHRGGPAAPTIGAPSAPPGAASGVVMPPFGGKVVVRFTGGLPGGAARAAAAIGSNFELAYLYAQFTAGKDTRWKAYTSPEAASVYQTDLASPSVTGHSFRGIVHFSRIRAVRDRQSPAAYDVSGCDDISAVILTNLRNGKPLRDALPADQHYMRYTDVVAQVSGRWVVITSKGTVYYPQARECKP